MESKTNYTVVGLMVVLLTIGLLTTALWLSIGFDHKKYNKYTVYMRESVSGLGEQSIVKYNGVKVGFVDSIELSTVDPELVKVILNIQEGTPITTSTEATLITQGITGSTSLGLSATSPVTTPLGPTPGEPYPVIPYKSSFFGQLQKSLTKVSQGLNRLLNKENIDHFNHVVANLESISQTIANNGKNVDQFMHDLPILSKELKDSIQEFTSMSKDVAKAGKQVSSTMQAGRNAVDKISHQAIPPAVLLLQRMDIIAANLEQLSGQMRNNPAVILRGSTPPKPGPGEAK